MADDENKIKLPPKEVQALLRPIMLEPASTVGQGIIDAIKHRQAVRTLESEKDRIAPEKRDEYMAGFRRREKEAVTALAEAILLNDKNIQQQLSDAGITPTDIYHYPKLEQDSARYQEILDDVWEKAERIYELTGRGDNVEQIYTSIKAAIDTAQPNTTFDGLSPLDEWDEEFKKQEDKRAEFLRHMIWQNRALYTIGQTLEMLAPQSEPEPIDKSSDQIISEITGIPLDEAGKLLAEPTKENIEKYAKDGSAYQFLDTQEKAGNISFPSEEAKLAYASALGRIVEVKVREVAGGRSIRGAAGYLLMGGGQAFGHLKGLLGDAITGEENALTLDQRTKQGMDTLTRQVMINVEKEVWWSFTYGPNDPSLPDDLRQDLRAISKIYGRGVREEFQSLASAYTGVRTGHIKMNDMVAPDRQTHEAGITLHATWGGRIHKDVDWIADKTGELPPAGEKWWQTASRKSAIRKASLPGGVDTSMRFRNGHNAATAAKLRQERYDDVFARSLAQQHIGKGHYYSEDPDFTGTVDDITAQLQNGVSKPELIARYIG